MKVGTKEDVLISIVPVLDAPVSRGHLCVKGRYAFDFVSAGDRITKPMIRSVNPRIRLWKTSQNSAG